MNSWMVEKRDEKVPLLHQRPGGVAPLLWVVEKRGEVVPMVVRGWKGLISLVVEKRGEVVPVVVRGWKELIFGLVEKQGEVVPVVDSWDCCIDGPFPLHTHSGLARSNVGHRCNPNMRDWFCFRTWKYPQIYFGM